MPNLGVRSVVHFRSNATAASQTASLFDMATLSPESLTDTTALTAGSLIVTYTAWWPRHSRAMQSASRAALSPAFMGKTAKAETVVSPADRIWLEVRRDVDYRRRDSHVHVLDDTQP